MSHRTITTTDAGNRRQQATAPLGRRYTITHGDIGIGLVLTEEQFDLLLAAHEAGWDTVLTAIELTRTENKP